MGAQANTIYVAYLHGVVVTLGPDAHTSHSLSLFRQQNSKESRNCGPLQNHCSLHLIANVTWFGHIFSHREQQDEGACLVVLWMRSNYDYCIYHCVRGASLIPRREDVYV